MFKEVRKFAKIIVRRNAGLASEPKALSQSYSSSLLHESHRNDLIPKPATLNSLPIIPLSFVMLTYCRLLYLPHAYSLQLFQLIEP